MKWFSIKDKFPSGRFTNGYHSCEVLAYLGNAINKKVEQVRYCDGKFYNDYFDITRHVSHWTELPKYGED